MLAARPGRRTSDWKRKSIAGVGVCSSQRRPLSCRTEALKHHRRRGEGRSEQRAPPNVSVRSREERLGRRDRAVLVHPLPRRSDNGQCRIPAEDVDLSRQPFGQAEVIRILPDNEVSCCRVEADVECIGQLGRFTDEKTQTRVGHVSDSGLDCFLAGSDDHKLEIVEGLPENALD
jgi:hypothetical protein